MGIVLTEEEKRLAKEGKLDVMNILKHRAENPQPIVDHNEVEQVKSEIREANVLYKEAIQRNKDLYEELQENRKLKEQYRNQIAELRLKKKKLLGID